MNFDFKDMAKAIAHFWDRGSLFLWALTAASTAALLIMDVFIFFASAPDLERAAPVTAVVVAALFVLAVFKSLQEATIKTVALNPEPPQSFWHHAPQPDGRELTQVHLTGSATNLTEGDVYLADVRLLKPKRNLASKYVSVQRTNGIEFGFDNAIPAKSRSQFSVDMFVDGFVGVAGTPLTIKISLSDQFGRRHEVRYVHVRNA